MAPKKPEDEEQPEFDAFSSNESETDENHLWTAENGNVEKIFSTEEIPLMLSVEVGKLQINLEKLLQLSPGNVLELPVRPEQGVDLMLHGKKVAKAELIKIGEMLGVRILQLGE